MPPSDELGLAGGEAGDRHRRALAPQQDRRPGRRLAILAGRQREQRRAAARAADLIGAGAEAAEDDRHFRLGEQLQQIGARAAQRDFQHRVGHRGDQFDAAEHRLQRVAARPARGGAQPARDLLGGDRAAVGPGRAADPEGVAQAVVGDDPALRQRRLDLAGGVEADQPLRDRFDQEGRGRIERLEVRVEQARRRADRADRDRPAPVLAASAQRQSGADRKKQAAWSSTRPVLAAATGMNRPAIAWRLYRSFIACR